MCSSVLALEVLHRLSPAVCTSLVRNSVLLNAYAPARRIMYGGDVLVPRLAFNLIRIYMGA